MPKEHLERLPQALQRAITDKKLREENIHALAALRASEPQNRELVDNSTFGICSVDAGGMLLDANQALVNILGGDSHASLQKLIFGSNLFRYPEQYAQIMAKCRETGRLQGAETEWRRCDGQFIKVRLHLRFLRDPQSK